MSARRVAGGHVLPPNPVYLDFERTDGDQSLWPQNTMRIVDKDGQVNFYKPLELDDSSSINWRCGVAMKVAERLGRPGGKNYVLRSWPGGYKMYDHHKGKMDSPRHDLYLYGSINSPKFRSVPEFVPHALWLMTDPTLDRSNCECKYCAKKPQRIISESLGFTKGGRTSTPSSPMATPLRRPPRPSRDGREVRRVPREAPKPYAAIRRVPKPVKQATGPKQIMVYERFSDLQSVYSDLDMELRQWFREGELVWCALNPPIRGRAPEECITFWPGLVREAQVKSHPIPRAPSVSTHSADGDYEMENGTERAHPGGPSHLATPHPGEIDGQEVTVEPQWDVHQSTVYKVKLLSVGQDYVVPDDQVLPYQGYAPSQALLQAMQNVPIEHIPVDVDQTFAFNPCPSDVEQLPQEQQEQRFTEAVAPYSLAVEIASGIATYWTPTDDFDFHMTAPGPVPTLQEAITRATSVEGISSPRPSMTDAELLAHKTKVLGQQSVAPTYTQTRYQGLWLGPERIWCDELVRIKAVRRQIAPEGAPNIYPPSGPSKETLRQLGLPEDSDNLGALGALDRGVFMKLHSIYLVPDEASPGESRECRASGVLYELADEDWEEPEEIQKLEVEGKGKERENGINGTGPQASSSSAGLNDTPVSASAPPALTAQDAAPSTSPPNPTRLPNPDPAVPIAETVPSVLAAINQPAPPTPADDITSAPLSLPKMRSFPLPPAPHGFKFRPILPPGHEVVITITLISGRYYPRMLAHPLLNPVMKNLKATAFSNGAIDQQKPLLALEGIFPGFYNAVDASFWKPSRQAMVNDADAERTARMVSVWETRRKAETAMDTAPDVPVSSQVAVAS